MTTNSGLLLVAAYAGLTLAILTSIHSVQPDPYMDEIFHIPQAQKYCFGQFKEVREAAVS